MAVSLSLMSTAVSTSTSSKTVVAFAVAGGVVFAAMALYGVSASKAQNNFRQMSDQRLVQEGTKTVEGVIVEEQHSLGIKSSP